tara:strand:- start:637 stop:1515 length:879 start_codon:yes stop_codon:yes gene_type:complete
LIKTYETPSSISSYAYCSRLGGLDKLYSFGGSKSVATVIGNLEHAAFQEYYKMFNLDCKNIQSENFYNEEQHQIRTDKVIEYVSEFFPNLYPSYYQHILDEIPSVRYRLDLHYKQKIEEIKKYLNSSNNTPGKAVSMALPFEIEKKLGAYGIFGRVDCMYWGADGKSIIPEDLKSHATRFDSLIHQESHKIQLVTYAVLIEFLYKAPVREARIFYTKDLTYETFKITKKDKVEVLEMKDRLQTILNEGLPPVIEDPIKCKHCYKQNLCKEIADRGIVDPTEYIPLEGEEDDI